MAAITLKSDITLESSGDATPSGASFGDFTIPTLTIGNSNSIQRVYSTISTNNISWEEIQNLMSQPTNFENEKVISTRINRRGIRRSIGVLFPRGTYSPYVRRRYF